MKKLYQLLAWYLHRRWVVLRIIKEQRIIDNVKLINNMISTGMIKKGSNQHLDFIHMMRIYSK